MDDDAQQALLHSLSHQALLRLEHDEANSNKSDEMPSDRAGSVGEIDGSNTAGANPCAPQDAQLNAKQRRRLARIAAAQARANSNTSRSSFARDASYDGALPKLSSHHFVTLVWSLAKLKVVTPSTGVCSIERCDLLVLSSRQ